MYGSVYLWPDAIQQIFSKTPPVAPSLSFASCMEFLVAVSLYPYQGARRHVCPGVRIRDMPEMIEHIERFLSNPILWGIASIVAISIGLSGRFSVTGSSSLMWVAWAMASFGAYRIYAFYKLDASICTLATVASACIFAIAVLLVVRWMNTKEVASMPIPTTTQPSKPEIVPTAAQPPEPETPVSVWHGSGK